MVARQFWRSARAMLSSPAIWSRTPSWLPPIPARRATSVFIWRAVSPTVAGLAVWFMAAAVAVQGQLLAISLRPEDAAPWLVGAAVLGYVGVRLLERESPPDREADGLSTDEETIRFGQWSLRGPRRLIGGLAVMAL